MYFWHWSVWILAICIPVFPAFRATIGRAPCHSQLYCRHLTAVLKVCEWTSIHWLMGPGYAFLPSYNDATVVVSFCFYDYRYTTILQLIRTYNHVELFSIKMFLSHPTGPSVFVMHLYTYMTDWSGQSDSGFVGHCFKGEPITFRMIIIFYKIFLILT